MKIPAAWWLIGPIALALAACASYSPSGLRTGATLAEVERDMGPRTGEYPLPGNARRVEFARGPLGKHTYLLDFDANGRLLSWQQVLTEAKFAEVQPGMTRQQVLLLLGRPSHVMWLSYQKRQLWSYRYDAVFCVWFQVSLDTRDQVIEAGHGPDPLCDVDDRAL